MSSGLISFRRAASTTTRPNCASRLARQPSVYLRQLDAMLEFYRQKAMPYGCTGHVEFTLTHVAASSASRQEPYLDVGCSRRPVDALFFDQLAWDAIRQMLRAKYHAGAP